MGKNSIDLKENKLSSLKAAIPIAAELRGITPLSKTALRSLLAGIVAEQPGIDPASNKELPNGWSSLKVFSGKSMDDIFNIDNIPLMWIYQRLFLPHVIPKQINTSKKMYNKRKINFVEQKRLIMTAKIIAKYIKYNESKKYNLVMKARMHDQIESQVNDNQTRKNKKVLFLSYSNHYEKNKIYRIQGIIDQLEKKKIEPYVLFADKLSSTAKRNNIHLNTIYQHIDKDTVQKAEIKSQELYNSWKNIDKKKVEEILSVKCITIWPYVEPAFCLYFSKEFLYLTILYYEVFKKIIEEENISIVVTTAQNGLFERCCFAAAKTVKKPSLFIQHGIGTISGKPDNFLENTYLAVFGPYIKRKLIAAGIDSKRIVITGPIVYDEIINHFQTEKKNNTNILILTQPLVEDYLIEKEYYFQCIKKVIEICLSLNLNVNIKLHPREIHLKEYYRLALINNEKIKIHEHKNANQLYELLNKSIFMINFRSSTAILEASILNIPSVTIPLVKDMPAYFKDLDPSIHIPFNENMRTEIQRIVEHPEINQEVRTKTIKEFFSKIDGKASERAVKLILKLTKS